MSIPSPVRRVFRSFATLALLPLLACLARVHAAEPAAPVVALAPILRVDADAGPGESESLTPLLQAGLSDDPRWRMVERARLGVLQAEWAFARGGLADTATALREIRPLGASLLLICRPEPGDLSKPFASCEVIDAITAEPLAAARAELADRPFARWYRNPPPEDIAALIAAFRTALGDALAVRAAAADRRLLTPLFFTGPTDLGARLETALASEIASAPAWRLRRALRLDGSRAEALLAASGFSPDGSAPSAASGVYVWGRFEPADPAGAPPELRYWIWNGVAAPETRVARGEPAALAAEIRQALDHTPVPDAPPTPEAGQARLQLARQMVEEARALARSTGAKMERFFSRLPADLVHEPLRAQVMRLLASAAFLAPADAEIQEVWLRTALWRETSFLVTWDKLRPPYPDKPETPEVRRLRRELIAFAETFWRRPDGSLDLRLLAVVFHGDPSRLKSPGALAELRRFAALIGEPSAEELAPHLGLLADWLRALWERCPEYQNREAKFDRAFRRDLAPPTFDPPPAEVVETFETLWPLLRTLRHYPRNYPLNLAYLYPPGSPHLQELQADQVRVGPRPQPQPRIVSTSEPSLIALPPPAPPPEPVPLVPAPEAQDPAIARRIRERQAFFESIKNKSAEEQARLRTAFLEKQLADYAKTRPAGPPAVSAPPPPDTTPLLALDAIPSLTPAARLELLHKACAKPGQLALIRALLKAGADPLGEPSDQRPPLLIAIQARREDYVHALLDASPDLNRPWPVHNERAPTGAALLAHAIDKRLLGVANRLINLHPEHVKASRGLDNRDTLLGFTLKNGDMPLIRRVLQLGAEYSDISDDALIHLARFCPRADAPPAPPALTFADVREIIQHFRATAPSVINDLEDGESPLLAAVQRRHYELVEVLIAAGADPLRGQFMGESIPTLAARDPVMQRLLQGQPLARARVTPASDRLDGPALLALYQTRGAAALADVKITPALLAYQDAKGWTLLHHVIDRGEEPQALRLIAAGAPLETATARGQTPLTFAIFKKMSRVADALLARGANPSGRGNDDGATPLHAAAINEHFALMRRLIKAGADLNLTMEDDRRPLLCAAIWAGKNLETIQVFVEAGARLDLTNTHGFGPLGHAIGKNRVDVLEYLRGKGAVWVPPSDNPDLTPLRFAVINKAKDAILFLLRQGERDPGALAFATDPDIRALLSDAAQQDSGGKAFADEELWPAICKDKQRWRERVDAHLAAGGDVNYGARDWTPLMLAIDAANLELVRHLLAKGANPKIHPQRHRYKPAWDLSDVGTLRFAWNLSYGGSFLGANEATFAEIIKLLVPLEPVEDNQWMFLQALQERRWITAEAFLAAGIKPTAYMREQVVTEGRLKGADLERALALLK